MTKKAFDKIAEGLREARSIAWGKPNPLAVTKEIIAAHIEALCEEIPPREAAEAADWAINQVLCDAWENIPSQMAKAGVDAVGFYKGESPSEQAISIFRAMLSHLIISRNPEE